tara:strand:+ start:325 stop:834 length:510 start_codon:yes stop_codon:yes gene_type:complete
MKPLKKIILSCLFISLLLLSACGYSLRESSNELSQKDLILLSDNSELNFELISQLKLKGNNVFRFEDATNGNNLTIKIKLHELNKLSGALGAGARTTQVRLDYAISYELISKNKIIKENTFKSTNYLSFNQSDLLAMEREEKILIKNFINDAIKNIEFHLAFNSNEDSF